MLKERPRAFPFRPLLTRLTLVFCLGIFTDCSFTEKEAQLPPLVRAEHRLAKAERIRSDLPQKMAEILSVARTAAGQIRNGSIEATAEPMMRIYDRATADLAAKIPELTQLIQNGGSGEPITIQNRRTGETYRLRQGAVRHGEYSWTYFQQILDARTWRPRKGEQTVVIAGLGGTLLGVHRTFPPGSPPPRLESAYGYRVPVTSIIEFGRVCGTAPVDARLRLIDPRRRNTIEFNGQRFSLAADFSAPLLSYSRLNELWLGFINMIRGENMRITPGLLLGEPYDPNRIPVIFVHGLLVSGLRDASLHTGVARRTEKS